MDKIKATVIIVGATVVVTGGLVFMQFDKWFQDEPTGPGSGDVVPADEGYTDGKDRGNGVNQPGPGSGDVVPSDDEPIGPGSGDVVSADEAYTDGKDRGNGINEPGPGSGDVVTSDDEPTGPGSGDVVTSDDEPTGPGSGDVVTSDDEPTGPGSGDVVTSDDEPTGPGSGDVVTSDDEPTGPGSGDVLPAVVGSCNSINEASICIDYIGSYWATPQVADLNCDGVGIYSSQRCPQLSVGGCNTNAGTITEMITWFYGYGGAPIVPDNVQNASGVCNANPFGTWIPG